MTTIKYREMTLPEALLHAKLKVQTDFLNARQCADHAGKWERGRCFQCEIEELQTRLLECVRAIEDELGACDRKEIDGHPTLKAHERIAKRARAALPK